MDLINKSFQDVKQTMQNKNNADENFKSELINLLKSIDGKMSIIIENQKK